METDALKTGRAIRQAIDANAEIDAAFDSITYGKGSHVIGMFAAFIGEDRFRDGVRRYLSAHRHANATSADFFQALAEAAGDDRIAAAMSRFVEQQGVPLLLFHREGDKYTVRQIRYAPLGERVPHALWDIPLCVRKGARSMCHLFTGRSAEFSLKGQEPLLPNAGGAGYYRFELPERHWKALIARARHLTGGEALAVVDSLDASIRAGRGNIGELARLASKLVRHPDSYAADAAVDAMSGFVATGMVDAEGKSRWRMFRARLYAPLLNKLGFDPRAGAYADEAPERSQRRLQVVQKLLGTPRARKLRHKLIRATKAYLSGERSALDSAWFGPAFDLHIYLGGPGAAKALVEKALASEDPEFRPAVLDAVSRSGNAKLAWWLLEDLKDPRLRENERRAFLSGIMSQSGTRDLGYRWVFDNFDHLMSDHSGIFFASHLPGMFSHFCSVKWAEKIAQDLGPRFAGTTGELEFERAVERVSNCGKLDEQRGAEISADFAKLR